MLRTVSNLTILSDFVRRAYADINTLDETHYHQQVEVRGYILRQHGNPVRQTDNWIRPVNQELFVSSPDEYLHLAAGCLRFLRRLRLCGTDPTTRHELISASSFTQGVSGRTRLDRFLYTTVQATGCALDINNPNAERQFGLLYQRFLHAVIQNLGFSTRSLNLQVPIGRWELDDEGVPQACVDIELIETDMVVGPEQGEEVRTTRHSVWPEDKFATIKTCTKDRISQAFLDAVNIQRLSVWRIAEYMLFVHNDVQRAGGRNISWTFLPTNFRHGSGTFPLSAIYFSDMPGNVLAAKASGADWSRMCRFLSEFIVRDLWI